MANRKCTVEKGQTENAQWRKGKQKMHSGENPNRKCTAEKIQTENAQWRKAKQKMHSGEKPNRKCTVEKSQTENAQWRKAKQKMHRGEKPNRKCTVEKGQTDDNDEMGCLSISRASSAHHLSTGGADRPLQSGALAILSRPVQCCKASWAAQHCWWALHCCHSCFWQCRTVVVETHVSHTGHWLQPIGGGHHSKSSQCWHRTICGGHQIYWTLQILTTSVPANVATRK